MSGYCDLCSRPCWKLHGHHVLERQLLAREGFNEWDPRNRMDLCEQCHGNHTFGQVNRKISIDALPADAIAFAVDLFGPDRAALELARHYAPAREASS